MEGKITKIFNAADQIQAEMIHDHLKQNGIETMSKQPGTGEYMSIAMGYSVYGTDIYVREDHAAGSSSRSGSVPLCSPMYPYLPCPIRTAMRCGETKNEAVVNCLVSCFLPPEIFPSVCWRCVGDSNP